MSKKTVLSQIKTLLNIEVKLEQMKLDNGTVIESDSFEPGYEVFVLSGEDKIPLPIGEYTLEDARILTVVEDGMIAEIKDAEAEETPPATPPAPAEVPVDAQASPSTPKKIIESISKELFFSELEKFKTEILAEIKLAKVEPAEIVLSAVEVVEPLIHNPEKLSKQKTTFYKKESMVEFLNNRKK
jgi:hypothetical protein